MTHSFSPDPGALADNRSERALARIMTCDPTDFGCVLDYALHGDELARNVETIEPGLEKISDGLDDLSASRALDKLMRKPRLIVTATVLGVGGFATVALELTEQEPSTSQLGWGVGMMGAAALYVILGLRRQRLRNGRLDKVDDAIDLTLSKTKAQTVQLADTIEPYRQIIDAINELVERSPHRVRVMEIVRGTHPPAPT